MEDDKMKSLSEKYTPEFLIIMTVVGFVALSFVSLIV